MTSDLVGHKMGSPTALSCNDAPRTEHDDEPRNATAQHDDAPPPLDKFHDWEHPVIDAVVKCESQDANAAVARSVVSWVVDVVEMGL